MAQGDGGSGVNPQRLQRWFDNLQRFDPVLHEELRRRREAATYEVMPAVAKESPPGAFIGDFETLVREGRPALLVENGVVTRDDAELDEISRTMVDRVMEHASMIDERLPLVGRIDVANGFGSAGYVGTGWRVDGDLVVTNRHVAELIARRDGARFVFLAGMFGEPMRVSLDAKHEFGSRDTDAIEVEEVLWIEPDASDADVAFLRLKARQSDGTRPHKITLAEVDAPPGTPVVVIGYPARAPSRLIPDQDWMDRVFRRTYDIKRVAPGLMDQPSMGWSTHDCTTLGGNSGSVVLDPKSGDAVALHFAGLYMIENYAVPASRLARYLREQPWRATPVNVVSGETSPPPAVITAPASVAPAPAIAGTTVAFDLPIRITVSVGQPTPAVTAAVARPDAATSSLGIDAAVRELARSHHRPGVLAIRPGYTIARGRIGDRRCIVVAAAPERRAEIAAALPSSFGGHPVEVRSASLADQLGLDGDVSREAASSTRYDDDARTGDEFSFDEVHERMDVVCHVGPEYSWEVLEAFLRKTRTELVSSMYEFHAAHIADTIDDVLANAKMRIVLDPKTRDPSDDEIGDGDFDRSDTFADWGRRRSFQWIFAPLGGNGMVSTSYHIKVSVRDREAFWLSSGNWKQSSQPLVRAGDRENPRRVSAAGNREWHVVVEHAELARRFRSHILQDFKLAASLGGTQESPSEDEIFVDVPLGLEAIELEAPARELLEPLHLDRKVRVQPLLTPDGKGAVFSDAVLALIRSARHQLVFENQYINMRGAGSGYLKRLVDLLVRKSQQLDDFRMVLRSGMSGFWENMEALKDAGMDVDRCVRQLANVHTKGIVVDGARVLLGSHNWSATGVTLNRDASLVFDDEEIAGYYLRAFEIDWERANPIELRAGTEESVRVATSAKPQPGFRRMRLSEYLEG